MQLIQPDIYSGVFLARQPVDISRACYSPGRYWTNVGLKMQVFMFQLSETLNPDVVMSHRAFGWERKKSVNHLTRSHNVINVKRWCEFTPIRSATMPVAPVS